jgi:hypothetical protein
MQAYNAEKQQRQSTQEHTILLEQQIACLSGMGAQNDALRQELSESKAALAQLATAHSDVAAENACQQAALTSREQQVAEMRADLAESQHLTADLQGQLEATIVERDQALQCLSSMQDLVRHSLQLCMSCGSLTQPGVLGSRPSASRSCPILQRHAHVRFHALMALCRSRRCHSCGNEWKLCSKAWIGLPRRQQT